MDLAAYEAENAMEETHWWYVGRRKLFLRLMRNLRVPTNANILDVGTSTGTNLRMLRDAGYTNVIGVDLSPVAAQFCASKDLGTVKLGDICALPFDDNTFDFLLATDVIEHVADDNRAASEILRVLKPSACALLTVPAFPVLWSRHDVLNHHKRRYLRAGFTKLLGTVGLQIRVIFYFNYLLFFPIWSARLLMKLLRRRNSQSELKLNNPLLNVLLGWIFSLDVLTAASVRTPFGVSLLCIVTKPMTSPEYQKGSS